MCSWFRRYGHCCHPDAELKRLTALGFGGISADWRQVISFGMIARGQLKWVFV